jgi:ATPase family associated with various cellular activities (AAA)
MFATRAHESLERRIRDALQEPGRHPTLHGWTGVGKTSLIHHVCGALQIAYISVDASGTFEELMQHVLNLLGARASTELVEGSKTAGEASGGVLGLISGKASGEQSTQERSTEYAVPLEQAAADALARAEVQVLFVDNFEDLSPREPDRRGICRLIKACSARTRELGPDAPRIVIAGPTPVVQNLLLTDKAAARLTEPIEVPRMPADEIEQILVRGQLQLDMVFEDSCRATIVEYADGFPFYAHLYALQSSRIARRSGRRLIGLEDFETALDDIISSCAPPLKEEYSRAIRGRGQASVRQGTLAALATLDDIEVSVTDAQRKFLELHPQYERVERIRFVGRILRELRDEHGILEDAWLNDGRPGFRFRDPLMRVYVRLRTLQDRQEAAAEWRAALPP